MTLLRQIELEIANGKTPPQACKEAEITIQTCYHWRKEYRRLKLGQAKRLKDLERENARLKRLVVELSFEKQVLFDPAFLRDSAALQCARLSGGYLELLNRTSPALMT